ncbi:MAG: altronate dehydratase [Armatimonadetes bacterium]|nr:altronate dehydratase [Armatimonadota bacterium]
MARASFDESALPLHPDDHVAVARRDLPAGAVLARPGGDVTLSSAVPRGHKLDVRAAATGDLVRKYGQAIGFATQTIAPGDCVHTHNLGFGTGELSLDYAPGSELRPIDVLPPEQRATFQGYLRPDGRVGTRNYLAIVSTVNCASSLAAALCQRFAGCETHHSDFDGVIPIIHKHGCGGKAGWETKLLQRTLAGFAKHPNVGAYVLVGLGCEGNQLADLIETGGLLRLEVGDRPRPPSILLQEIGGTQRAIDEGVRAVERLIPLVAGARRTTQTADKLALAMQCGGSDGLSGITANPAVGAASDELVRHGGISVLGETPEIYGAEHLLTRRAARPEVAAKLLERIDWWRDYTSRNGFVIDNNPAPGNKEGGLTTIFEKSLGAVAKSGSAPLEAVYEYADPCVVPGLGHMDTPGYDPVSATGQVAGGCNLIVFTTGRGSCFGFKPAPVLKIATNTPLYEHMEGDMDLNAGTIFDGTESVREVGLRIFDRLLRLASGESSKSELLGVGTEEFNPWIIGCTM